jgi:hypothetical protein
LTTIDGRASTKAEKEIQSWRLYSDVLRDFERKIYNNMLDFARQYLETPAITMMIEDNNVNKSPTEILFMSILLAQQKLILWLQNELVKIRKELLLLQESKEEQRKNQQQQKEE